MKALSLQEPWATLIRAGVKRIETRSWKTNYRGPLLIHASQRPVSANDAHIQALLRLIPGVPTGCGHLLCRCRLADCVYMDAAFLEKMQADPQELLCGDYREGRYAWLLTDIEPLDPPIPAKGHLGLWNAAVIDS